MRARCCARRKETYCGSLLEARGFLPFTLGPRPLRVEVALPYALGAIARR